MRLGISSELKPVPWNEADVAKGVFLTLCLSLVLLVVANALTFSGLLKRQDLTLPLVLALEAPLVAGLWLFTQTKYRCGLKALGFQNFRAKEHLPTLALVLLTGVAFTNLYTVVVRLAGLEGFLPPPITDVVPVGTNGWTILVAAAVVVAPLVEEAFFRGFVFAGLLGRFGFGWAASISAFLFALPHFHPGAILPAFAMGLFLAWLYARTASLWSAVGVHFLYNSLAVAAVYGAIFSKAYQ